MALKYQALNGMVINKTTTINGYNPTDTTAFRLGCIPYKLLYSNTGGEVRNRIEGVGFLAPSTNTIYYNSATNFAASGDLSLNSTKTSPVVAPLTSVQTLTDAEGNIYCGSTSSYFASQFSLSGIGTGLRMGSIEMPKGVLRVVKFDSASQMVAVDETVFERKTLYGVSENVTTSSYNQMYMLLGLNITKTSNDIILGLQYIPNEITETQELIIPTINTTSDGYCSFDFTNTSSNSVVEIVIEDTSYMVLPNSTTTIQLTGTNNTLNTKSYYCKSYWKHDSEVGTIEFTPTAS